MFILPRRSLFLPVCRLVLVCVLISLLAPSPVRADVGPQPILPGGSSIKPQVETPIQMAAEVIVMNVRLATEADNALVELSPKTYGLQGDPVWFPAIAEVEADFTMANPTSEAVSITAWFPLASALENVAWNLRSSEIVPHILSFKVSVDGNPVGYTVSELPNPRGADKPPLPWVSFPVTFPGGKKTAIHVSYLLPLQPSVKGYEMVVYYVFQTGAGWAGPIGQAELILNLPYPASAGTLAGIPPGQLRLPPMYVPAPSGLPAGAVLEGNQARWIWKDFEPGPQDDFAIWLLQPGKWQELETARAAVQANPQDGQAWLDLASIYYSLSCTLPLSSPLIFSPGYIPPGIEAYQKAADLLPEHPAPHAGLALLKLAPYIKDKNAPPEVMQYVQDESKIAKELAGKNPTLAKEAVSLLAGLEDALTYYDYTAASPTSTLAPQPTLITTLIPQPTLTSTPAPTATPQPAPPTPTPLVKPEQAASQGQYLAIIVAMGIIGLVIVGYLALKIARRSAGK